MRHQNSSLRHIQVRQAYRARTFAYKNNPQLLLSNQLVYSVNVQLKSHRARQVENSGLSRQVQWITNINHQTTNKPPSDG